jgi:hypothetical protein
MLLLRGALAGDGQFPGTRCLRPNHAISFPSFQFKLELPRHSPLRFLELNLQTSTTETTIVSPNDT